MARIRNIKPEFFTSEDIVALSPMARLLYIALWCEADREGRLVWKPKTLKMRYLPGDDCDIDSLCSELVTGGLVCLYGEGLAFIPAFTTHQHVNPRESASQLPEPSKDLTRRHASARVKSRSDPQVGKERKGRIDTRHDADGFEAFWMVYPCHKARHDAEKAWAKLCPDEDLRSAILKAVASQSQSDAWLRDGGKYVPHAATWLNGKRWTDDVRFPNSDDIFAGAK